ncbi:MAG: multiheme c-type cytochrome, partial [Saprospiraceae bacterium]
MTYLFDSASKRLKVFLFTLLMTNVFLFLFVENAISQENDVHEALFVKNKYPSATECRSCHPVQYKEWSVSGHAYAQLSPVAISMQAAVTVVTNGTNGDFCIRCHTPVGINIKEPAFMSNEDRDPISLEGVTCIVCHRRKNAYGKVSGRFAMVEGDLFEPVYGPMGNDELERVLNSGDYDVNTERGKEGRAIHTEAKKLSQISTSAFCGSCHDVYHVNGFRVEETFSEFKSSPAAKKGVTCQDCHMGKEPGIPSGYFYEPIAIVGGKPTAPRKRTSHMFVGPDYSIINPGIFPQNPAAQEMATLSEWLEFDYKARWGTDEFEDSCEEGYEFPERWKDVADRYEARAIINENVELLKKAAVLRKKLLQRGYQLGDVIVKQANKDKIVLKVEFKSGTEGHNVPTGFDAERIVFLRVTVTDKNGKVVFKSGDLDPNGDLRDIHSAYVHNGELPRDKQLFSLQTNFVVKMIRGGEREQVLPLNHSPSPLQFLRPSTRSTILVGRPGSVRKHRRTIKPVGGKWAEYAVKKSQLKDSEGPYTANIKIIAGNIPPNLVKAIQVVGFEYGLSPREIAEEVVDGHITLWDRDVLLKPGRFAGEPIDLTENSEVDDGQENSGPFAIYTQNDNSSQSFDEGTNAKMPEAMDNPGKHSDLRLSDEAQPLQLGAFPKRPRPIFELGNSLLGTGKVKQGFKLPTGAVWQPSFIAWGTYRTALQSLYNGDDYMSEWANRFDLFTNLYLTPTERIVSGFRFLDQEGRFTGYTFDMPGTNEGEGFNNELNYKLNTLFFEGDFGEIFPFLDKKDKAGLDFGLSVGRQWISFQDGMLINDNLDAIGVTKINLKPGGTSNFRTTFLWGFNELNRRNLPAYDPSSSLFGSFNEIDWRKSTVDFDVIYVDGNGASGDGIYGGLSSTQRLGKYNTTFRALGSMPISTETEHNKAGLLLL